MKLLYATNNPGKFAEVAKHLKQYKINVISPQELAIDIDPDESGNSLEENATIKAKAFIQAINDENVIIMADDTGVEIDALNGEPGIHVRRWKGYKMSDREIIDHCLERMKGVPKEKRGAQFRTVIALGAINKPIKLFKGILRGEISKRPIKLKMKGLAFEPIFRISKWGIMLGDLHQISTSEKENKNYLTHRERAIDNALPTIKKLLNS